MVVLFTYLDLAVVERINDGEALTAYASLFDDFATMLEGFLYDETHADELAASLVARVDDTLGGIAIGEEVVNKQHLVFGGEILLRDDYFFFRTCRLQKSARI